MQTFLPYADFKQSAAVLDRQRLGKQRVENLQIMKALLDPSYGWQNHPAVNMWRDHILSLMDYQVAICNEWTGRGYKDTCLEKSFALINEYKPTYRIGRPSWIGNEQFHISHRSNLLRKFPEHYGPLFEPNLSANIEYYWPLEQLV